MNLYIETENGQPKNHPAFEDNLLEAFGAIPEHWEAFVRVERPSSLGLYEVFDDPEVTYEKIDGVWKDVWRIRNMTDEEKSAKQQAARASFNKRYQAENWSAWTLDEATCEMQPTIPRPDLIEGVDVRWCGADNNWKEVPNRPVNEYQYRFNFLAWQWDQVIN